MINLAFDIGGTFTDFVLQDEKTGAVAFLKVPSTPSNPSKGVIEGLDALFKHREKHGSLDEVTAVLHATTVATNAVIERKGAPTALITTLGFRDLLTIGRQKRYDTYNLALEMPRPILKRRQVFEVAERVAFDGRVVQELDEATVQDAIEKIRSGEFESVAVCLLHSYANPSHENRIAELLAAKAPGIAISLSSDISPKYREYERTNTTVANAYVKPIVQKYVAQLESELATRGFENELFIMQSSGGLVSPEFARRYPIRIIESGPAAGVLMCAQIGKMEGFSSILTFDMGGTTAKLGAVQNNTPAISPVFEIDPIGNKKGSGLPVNVPSVELIEIGAGGGSIARPDDGMIAVGPESAGSQPGPVCYGRGGQMPTVTDANLVLGYINPAYFNRGSMTLDVAAAGRSIRSLVAEPLGLSLPQAAWGIHLVATANMEHALRLVSVERGRDPRDFAMIAFGGAGPLHATRLARLIGIPKVVVPYGAGVGSALGLLHADARVDVSTTSILTVDAQSDSRIREIYKGLQERAGRDVSALGVSGDIRWSRYAYMRYSGQGFELRVDLPGGDIVPGYAGKIAERFYEEYGRQRNWRDTSLSVEGVDWALVATVVRSRGAFAAHSEQQDAARREVRSAWFPEVNAYVPTVIMNRRSLAEMGEVVGPAIIEDPDCTAVILPGDIARLSPHNNLIIEIDRTPK